jgi:hypothetical protein
LGLAKVGGFRALEFGFHTFSAPFEFRCPGPLLLRAGAS